MIYLYPANKMENLLVLFDKIQQISPLPIFSQEIIVVQNAGMQHWLNLSLAQQRGISMNFRYALPSQYLWQLVRTLVSSAEVPQQSPYSREVLSWRIDQLLTSKQVLQDDSFEQVTSYWQSHNKEMSALKRFQLAIQLADLFEQYLIFRPDWLDNWQHNVDINFTDETCTNETITEQNKSLALWQAKLWRLLINQLDYNPKVLIHSAIQNLTRYQNLLPARVIFFGINSLAPIWLEFISALSEHLEVHFFHLNPCYAYWGDILTEKQACRNISTWLEHSSEYNETVNEQVYSDLVGNPLLANFGQQGREFLALLQQYSTINIEAFELAGVDFQQNSKQSENGKTKSAQITVLQHLQNDILTLTDARNLPHQQVDDSITITSCHSALREVQGLHDWLLHQFNQDHQLTPKDILVMCPQVENYAPYIDAVFSQGWQDIGERVPPLPCSIADRTSLDAEPLVAAFIELLNLPDSRFQVSKLITLLRLPAMQSKFSITLEDIDKLSYWLEQATIHWGLNGQHKQSILKLNEENECFTWQYGLSRLLLGFAFGDDEVIYAERLLCPSVEGNDAELLGKLIQIIEQLQTFSVQLKSAKSAATWFDFLNDLLEQLFLVDADPAFELIEQALTSLIDYSVEAKYQTEISLSVVREFLQSHFSQPDAGRQFLVGQVTFCSMLPMRSIPFKVIAILGLNDGEFPRQRQHLAFDLMAISAARMGDRSRRGDDRYLFLEAIICARQALYLSFQGKNIRNNNDLQASLVLKELMEYLELGYGWCFSDQSASAEQKQSINNLRQLAMQPFSPRNYQGEQGSFDANWRRFALKNKADPQNTSPLVIATEQKDQKVKTVLEISLEQLVSFFEHPAKYFAKHQLNLHFEHYQAELSDTEPFVNNALQSYLLKQALLQQNLAESEQANEQPVIEQVLRKAKLSGKFADSPVTEQEFAKWQQDNAIFSNHIKKHQAENPTVISASLTLKMNEQQVVLTAQLPIKNQQCVSYRSSSAKSKDFLTTYLYRLFTLVYQRDDCQIENEQTNDKRQALNNVAQATSFNFDTKKQQVMQYSFVEINEPKQQLINFINTYIKGQQQALLINGIIAERYFNAQKFDQAEFETLWQGKNNFKPLGDDPYMQYFWNKCPDLADICRDLEELYQGLYDTMESKKL